jgi:hypothetical protein
MGVACMGGVDGCATSGTTSAAATCNAAAGKEKGAKKGGKKSAVPVAQGNTLLRLRCALSCGHILYSAILTKFTCRWRRLFPVCFVLSLAQNYSRFLLLVIVCLLLIDRCVLVVTDEALQEAMDLPAAQFHFETALEMMNKLKEEQREQEGPDAPVSVCAGAVLAYVLVWDVGNVRTAELCVCA